MMPAHLAEAMVDPQISGNWIIAVIGALGSAFALFYGKRQGIKEAANSITIASPVPKIDVTTKEHPDFVTHNQLNGHLERIEDTFNDIKKSLDNERTVARTANGNLHQRIDKVIENQAESRGELKQINLNVQRLLNRSEGKPPRA